MHFPFNCLGCGHENFAEWAHIGRQVFCVACGRVATIPAPMEPAGGEYTSGLAVRFACPACGRNFATRTALVGLKIRCNGCGAGVRVPACNSFPVASESGYLLIGITADRRAIPPAAGPNRGARRSADHSIAVTNVSRGAFKANSGDGRAMPPSAGRTPGVILSADHSIIVPSASGIAFNPNSGGGRGIAPTAGGAIWTVEDRIKIDAPSLREHLDAVGGVNRFERTVVVLPSRAETMEQVRDKVTEQAAVETKKEAEKAKKATKRQRKRRGFFDLQETLILVGAVSVFVGVLTFLGWYFPEFRYPLGGLLTVIGVVFYLLGAMSLRRIAANEGFLKSMLYRFFPPYQLYFVVSRWEETQDYFLFFASGLIIVAIGVTVFFTSPTAKKAELSERAYQEALDEYVRGKGPPPPMMKKMDNRSN